MVLFHQVHSNWPRCWQRLNSLQIEMATEYKLIPDIKPGESGWTIKGNKVQATLFDNAIIAFEDTLLPQKTYLISNAQVKETDKNYAAQIGNIRWTINAKTNIVEVNEQFNSLLSLAYTLIPFQNLQPYMETSTEISIIGIVIDIFPKRVIQIRDSQSTVQDVILIDERPENNANTVNDIVTKSLYLPHIYHNFISTEREDSQHQTSTTAPTYAKILLDKSKCHISSIKPTTMVSIM